MATHVIEAKGLNCPQPVLKLATKAIEIPAGDLCEVTGDCPTFEKDIRAWCERMGKTILEIIDEGESSRRVKIQF
ncbi:MAG: sulfurtransferase TusA family protein [Spirochaetes bacterium]|nr:sulfurtransferase TusA family protein [Spirochaetota bacterium]